MERIERSKALALAFRSGSAASANIIGSNAYTKVHGTADFYQTEYGVVVVFEIYGLPLDDENGVGRIFACRIHEGKSCTGGGLDRFSGAIGHYNPLGLEHPNHAGDLPPIFGYNDVPKINKRGEASCDGGFSFTVWFQKVVDTRAF